MSEGLHVQSLQSFQPKNLPLRLGSKFAIYRLHTAYMLTVI